MKVDRIAPDFETNRSEELVALPLRRGEAHRLRNIRADRAADHSATDRALLEAAVAALADGVVAAWDEHYRARTRHAHHADAVLIQLFI